MRILLVIGLVCTLVLALVQNLDDSFDFATATPEARIKWLDRQVPSMEGEISSTVRSSFGLLSPIKVGALTPKASRSVDGYIEINKAEASRELHAIRKELKTALCPRYLKTKLSKQVVRVNLDFINNNDRRIGRLVLSPSACEDFDGMS